MLVIDLDPQANLTQAMGYEEPEPNLYHLLKQEFDGEAADIQSAIIHAKEFEFIPASLDLANAELEGCRLTAIFQDQSIEEIADFIAQAFSLEKTSNEKTYTLVGNCSD